jgi:hypothetical protein
MADVKTVTLFGEDAGHEAVIKAVLDKLSMSWIFMVLKTPHSAVSSPISPHF